MIPSNITTTTIRSLVGRSQNELTAKSYFNTICILNLILLAGLSSTTTVLNRQCWWHSLSSGENHCYNSMQLMQFMWTGLLPMVIAFILLVPSLLVAFDIAPY